MKPVTKSQYIKLVRILRKMLESIEGDVECAINFSTEFGSVVLMRNTDGKITMAIVINGVPAALFDYSHGYSYWTMRGDLPQSCFSKLEIYDYAMELAERAKKVTKKEKEVK